MKIAFYKAFQKRATFLDNIIAIFTFGRYSHVEIIFSDDMSFSVSPREGTSRFKYIEYSEIAWDIFDLDISSSEEKELRKLAENELLNKKYDYIGAVFSATKFCIQKKERVFCSEIATNLLRKTSKYYYLKDGCRYSPNELFKKLPLRG